MKRALALALVTVLAAVATGCVYKGGKVTEGTDLAVGMNVPMSDGVLQLQVLNYLSGFRVGVDQNARMTIRYTCAETNDYLGIVHTKVAKTADVTIEPCENDPAPQEVATVQPDGTITEPKKPDEAETVQPAQ